MQCPHLMTVKHLAQDLTIPCGQCHACRVRRREELAARIILEADNQRSWFVTLTYRPTQNTYLCDEGKDPVPTLCKQDRTLFLKRLRKRFPTGAIRYFFVGEYGSRTGRPHWHCVLFGLEDDPSDAVDASWGLGFISCAELTLQRARYVARYTTKKMTGPMSYDDGRSPELASWSKHPALGHRGALKIARRLIRGGYSVHEIPLVVNFGEERVILDRHMRSVIMEELGNGQARQELSLYKAHAKSPQLRAVISEDAKQVLEEIRAQDLASHRTRDAI